MGQICAKCTKAEETEDGDAIEEAGGHERASYDAPLLDEAVPPAAESPVSKSPAAERPEPHVSKAPVAEPLVSEVPVAEPLTAEAPVVVPPAAQSSVAQDAPVPVSQQQNEGGGSSIFPSLAPSAVSAFSTPPKGKYLQYPIMQDVTTIQYVMNSKVLVILKGLPGSGKSFIASRLKQVYKDAVVCSADYYFMKDGKYKFKAEELNLAHEFCQESSKKAAVTGVSVIIIDNTNVRAWNYKYYLRLSKEHHYTPLIMEPQTPWAKNTKELAKKNNHGVEKEILDQKLKSYEAALPLYYWWFLNEADSAQIISLAQDWLKKALEVQSFLADFSFFSKLSTVEEMLKYYKRNENHTDYKVLHATACVARRGKAKNAKEYIARNVVKGSLGKCFTLQVIGFVITPRTYGVRLRLGEDALELWGMDDNETEEEDTAGKQPSKSDKQSEKEKRVTLANTSVTRDFCQTTLREGPSQLREDRFSPTAGRGSRAHLTLGCAPGVHAKITGFDLMKVVSHEQEMMKTENFDQLSEKMQTFSVPEGELRTYGDNIWVIYPEKEIHVNSLFSAFY